MTFVVKLFGLIPLLTVELSGHDFFEVEEDDEGPNIEGGSAHDFERDSCPLSPTSHHEWEWEDKGRFGFA
jgi:hypothetical protein